MSVTWPSTKALAVCRMLLGAAVMLNALEISVILGRIVDGSLAMPALIDVPITAGTVEAWTLIAFLAGGLVACGVLTQVSALAASATCLFAMLWDQQAYTNHFWLTTLMLAFLAFTRSDAQWSMRAAARGRLTTTSPTAVLLMITQLSVCYFFAALSKLNPWWINGDELHWSLRFDAPELLYTPLAISVICTELFIAVGIWFRRTRPLALLVGIGLHISIVLLMHEPLPLITFTIVCLSLYPLVATAPYARDLLGAASRTQEPAAVCTD